MHEAIKDMVETDEEFTAEDWKFLEEYSKLAGIKASKKHEQDKMKEGLKGCDCHD